MRTFVAFDFEEEIQKDSLVIINRVKNAGFEGSWTKEGNFHLTLFFLGEQDKEEIIKATESFFSKLPKGRIPLISKGISLFFRNGSPSVIWMGFQREKKLEKFFETGNTFYSSYVSESKNRFVPHLTLGRLKRVPDDYEDVMNSVKCSLKEYEITGITLYKSELTKNGPIYTPLKTLYF